MRLSNSLSRPTSPAWMAWPLPALMAWALAWVTYRLVEPNLMAHVAALAPPAWLAWKTPGLTRRSLILAGFPLSLMLLDASLWPAWLWLLPAAILLALYPIKAWRDAPVFPTRAEALVHLAERLRLVPGSHVLDAGCGAGHGLLALLGQWPQARVSGIEHSWPLVLLARLRCPRCTVLRGDMWAHRWGRYDVVYLFQRPESMARAWAKAQAEMKPGAWLISLEFVVPDREPDVCLQAPGERAVLAYRLPGIGQPSTQSKADPADKPVDVPTPRVGC
jgi:SAM-dependent methyltransferase